MTNAAAEAPFPQKATKATKRKPGILMKFLAWDFRFVIGPEVLGKRGGREPINGCKGGSPRELAQMGREIVCGLELLVRSRTDWFEGRALALPMDMDICIVLLSFGVSFLP